LWLFCTGLDDTTEKKKAFHWHGGLSRQLTAAFEGSKNHNAFLEGKRLIYIVLNTESRQLPALDNINLQKFFLSSEELQKPRWCGTGAGCPEKLWMPPPWKCSRPGWMGL